MKKRSADGLFKRPGSKYWQCWINGERRSTGCTDRQAARAVKANLERVAADPKRYASELCDLQGAVEDFEAYLRDVEDKPGSTRHFYALKCRSLIRYFGGETKLAQLADAKVWQRFINERSTVASRNTVGHELTTAKRVLRIAKLNGAFPHDLDEVFPPRFARNYKPRERALTLEECGKLLDALDAESPRLAGFVAWEIATASRKSEVERAEAMDVEADGAIVRIRGQKTREAAKRIPIAEMFRPALAYAVERGAEDGPMFGVWHNPSRDLAAACRRAGIPACTTNDLRRTHAQLLNAAGVDLRAIAQILRHTSSRMVEQVYAPTSTAVARKLLEDADRLPKKAQASVPGSVLGEKSNNIRVIQCPGTELNRRHEDFQSQAYAVERLLARLSRPERPGAARSSAKNSTLAICGYPPGRTKRIERAPVGVVATTRLRVDAVRGAA